MLWDKLKSIQEKYENENSFIWFVINNYILFECYDTRNLFENETMDFIKKVVEKGSINVFDFFDEDYCITKFKHSCEKGLLEVLESNRKLGVEISPLNDIPKLYCQAVDLVFKLVLNQLEQ